MQKLNLNNLELLEDIKQKRPFSGIDYPVFNTADGIHKIILNDGKGCIFSKTFLNCKIDISIIKEKDGLFHFRSRAFKKEGVIAYDESEEISEIYSEKIAYSFFAKSKPKVQNFIFLG